MKITTNILDIKIDYDKVDRDFVIVEFKSNTDKKPNPIIFDVEDVNMYSLTYSDGLYAYALMDENGYKDLLQADMDETISYKRVDALYADKYKSLTRLFLNALANYRSDLAYNNLTGKFYKFDSRVYINTLKMEELGIHYDSINDITTLKCNTCTFIRIDKYDRTNAIYTFDGSNNNTLRRCFKPENSMFIKKGRANRKASKVFLALQDGSGRAKIMYDLIKDLNETFSDYIKIGFKEYDILDFKPSRGVKLQEITKDLIINHDIAIVNLTKEEENIERIESLKHNIEVALNKKIKVCKKFQKNCFNIAIIHEKEYYEKKNMKDIYQTIDRNVITQCVTIEEIKCFINDDSEKMTPPLVTILKELLIKNDVVNTNTFSLDNWAQYSFENDWEFIKRDEETKNIYKMTINKDGKYEMEKYSMSSFDFTDSNNYSYMFNKSKDLELVIKDDKGNINCIERTDIIAMPSSLVFNSLPIRRTKKARSELYPGLCNINYFEINNNKYYNVGQDYKNVQLKFVNASHLRRIIIVDGSKNLVEELLDLMSVSFVKYNELTILPYPVKYLNEYIEMNK